MTFKKYLEEQIILNESLLEIPEQILKPIMDFYLENYKKYMSRDMQRVDRRSFPPKVFPLDFSGTNLEFLNKLNPKPSVKVYFKSGLSYYSDLDRDNSEDSMFYRNRPMISFDFDNFRQSVYHVVEHEMIHVVQHLIKKYKYEYKNIRGDHYSRIKIGGLPSKRLIRGDVDTHGFKRSRRVEHSQRPVEAYTDALSLVRQMQAAYQHESKVDPKISKSDFFKKMLSEKGDYYLQKIHNGDGTNDLMVVHTDIFKAFKKVGDDFYKKMLSIMYNAFVNGDYKFSVDYIEDKKKEMHRLNAIAIQKKETAPRASKPKTILPEFKFKDGMKMGIRDFCNDFIPKDFVTEFYGSYLSMGQHIAGSLGIQKQGSEIVSLPTQSQKIVMLFRRLRLKKEAEQNLKTQIKGMEPEKIIRSYDRIFNDIKSFYLGKAAVSSDNDRVKLESMIDQSYKNERDPVIDIPQFYFDKTDMVVDVNDFPYDFMDGDILHDYFEGFIITGESIASSLGIMKNRSGRVYFPTKTSDIIKLFKKLHEFKIEKHVTPYNKKKMDDETINSFYDYMFEKMKSFYIKHSGWMPEKSQKVLENIINQSYS